MAHGLAAPRRLNLDYLGTQLGQIGGAGRTEDVLRTGEHAAALQRLGLAESLLEVECLVAEFFKSRLLCPSSASGFLSHCIPPTSDDFRLFQPRKVFAVEAERSEERRVGKECRSGWAEDHDNKRE